MANLVLSVSNASAGLTFDATSLDMSSILLQPLTAVGSGVLSWTDTMPTFTETITMHGTGLVPVTSGGNLIDVTGGHLTSVDVHITIGSVILDAKYTGLIADAAHFFDLAFANNAKGLVAYAMRGDDRIVGSSASDIINGYAGSDVIHGGSGNDTITGGAGHDNLTGGLGTDHFVFTDGADASASDLITDFSSGTDPAGRDHIDLSHIGFAGLGPVGVMTANHFSMNVAQSSLATVIWHQTTGVLGYDADGTGAGLEVIFAQIPSNRVVHFFDFDVI